MKFEIESAANFLSNLLKLHSNILNGEQLELFKVAIESHLAAHYRHHWFPERPNKGSAYRCIRINHKMDPILAKAGQACGMDQKQLRTIFPNELTLWIDPREVSYRIGENGSICVLFDGDAQDDSSNSSTSSSNSSSSVSSFASNNSNSMSMSNRSSASTNLTNATMNGSPPNHSLSAINNGHHNYSGDSNHLSSSSSSSNNSNNMSNHGNYLIMRGGPGGGGNGTNNGAYQQQHNNKMTNNGLSQHGNNSQQLTYQQQHQQQQQQHQAHNNHNNYNRLSPTDSTLSSTTSTLSSPSPSSSPDWCRSVAANSERHHNSRSSPVAAFLGHSALFRSSHTMSTDYFC